MAENSASAARRPGRPKMTEEQKAAKRAEKAAAQNTEGKTVPKSAAAAAPKADAPAGAAPKADLNRVPSKESLRDGVAPDWAQRLPATKEDRIARLSALKSAETEIEAAKEEMRSALKEIKEAADIKGHMKRLTEVLGFHPIAIKIKKEMEKLGDEARTVVWRQLRLMGKDFAWDSSPGLFDEMYLGDGELAGAAGDADAEEDKPVFDNSKTADRGAGSLPVDTRSEIKSGDKKNPPVPPRDTGALSEGEALAAFEGNVTKLKPRGRPPAAPSDNTASQMKAVADAGDEHIRQTAAKGRSAGPPAQPDGAGLGPDGYH